MMRRYSVDVEVFVGGWKEEERRRNCEGKMGNLVVIQYPTFSIIPYFTCHICISSSHS